MENTIRKNKIIQAIAVLMASIIALSSIGSVTALAASVPKTSITSVTATTGGFKVSYKKVSGADGYQVQYATNKSFTKNKKSVSYTAKSDSTAEYDGLKSNTKYYVRVRSFKISSNKFVYSSWSSTKTVTPISKLKKTTVKTTWKTSNTLKITWKKISGAKGYQIQYATNEKFTKNKKTYTVKKASKTSKTIKVNLSIDYYVRVRSYKTINGTKYYSAWSSVKWGDYSDVEKAYKIVQTLGIKNSMSDLEKVARVQNWINHNWYYTYSGSDIWKTKHGNCSDFAEAFEAFMDCLGVESSVVSGSEHAWNIIKIDGYWYQYDCETLTDCDYDNPEVSRYSTGAYTYCYRNYVSRLTYYDKGAENVISMTKFYSDKWLACSPKGDTGINIEAELIMYQLVGLDRDSYIASYTDSED